MINQLTISDWQLAMNYRLVIGDFVTWIPNQAEDDRDRSLQQGRDDSAGKSLIGDSVGVALC